MDLQWIPDAYEAANRGDWTEVASRMSPDYRHIVPSLGIEWIGREPALQGLREAYAATGLTQSAVDAVQHGPYVLVSVTGHRTLNSESFDAVHVFRIDGDQLAECWAHYPPA